MRAIPGHQLNVPSFLVCAFVLSPAWRAPTEQWRVFGRVGCVLLRAGRLQDGQWGRRGVQWPCGKMAPGRGALRAGSGNEEKQPC